MVVGTDAFASLAAMTAAARGMGDLPVVTVPHPLGGADATRVAARAEGVFDAVVRALTTTPAAPFPPDAAPPARVNAPDTIDEFQAFAMAEGWGDGLPVLPPTPERVERILAGAAADELVATIVPRRGRATLATIAVNAALAGAGAEHMAVLVAAVRAVADRRFNLEAIQATTHPCAPLVIVNGPVARRLGVNGGANALGGGARANAVIGRSLRLVLQNVGGARPGAADRATLGHPGKFSYCLAENERASPWPPLHAERGFDPADSCVTVCGAEAPHNVNDHASASADALMHALAGTAATTGNNHVFAGGEPLVLLGPEHARTVAASGWSKQDFKRAFWERARVRLDRFAAANLARFAAIAPARFRDQPSAREIPLAPTPDDVMVVVAGGPGKHSAIVPTFGATQAITIRIPEGAP